MKIGLSRPMSAPKDPVPDVDLGLVAQAAEQMGFEWLSYGHHTVTPLEEKIEGPHTGGVPMYQDPIVGFARASGLTSRLEFYTGVLIVPMLHPVALAKQLASVDQYSGGRLTVGLGTGGASRQEIEASGGRWDRRWAYLREAVIVMKGLWSHERFEFEGEFFEIPPVICRPAPFQKPCPRIVLGAVNPVRVIPRILEYADGFLPAYFTPEMIAGGPDQIRGIRKAFDEGAAAVGRKPSEFEISAILVGDVDRDMVHRFEDASADRLAVTLPQIESIDEARAAMERIAGDVL